MILLDGKSASTTALEDISRQVKELLKSKGRVPHLAIILVGKDGASQTYVTNKLKTCERVGFQSTLRKFDSTISESELLSEIERVNSDDSIDGLIVQSPLPEHIQFSKITSSILHTKDVDGFNPINTGRLVQNIPSFVAATPKGIMMLLEHYKIPTSGKRCVVLGRSNIVGMPMSLLLSKNSDPGNCTVTICHSRTLNVEQHTKEADIIVAAIGKPGYLTGDMVKEGAVVIDVGITRIKDASKKSGYRLSGDVDFDSVKDKASFITPVPGGVGPMTIAGLLSNTLAAARNDYYN